jgi:hypothetical protein
MAGSLVSAAPGGTSDGLRETGRLGLLLGLRSVTLAEVFFPMLRVAWGVETVKPTSAALSLAEYALGGGPLRVVLDDALMGFLIINAFC